MMPFFTGPLPVQCVGGRRPGIFADATQDCSTSEDFSPSTVLTKNICRCIHHILQHFPTTMRFLTVSAITYSWMASTATQADSWWLGHVEPDNVVIADIAGQALDQKKEKKKVQLTKDDAFLYWSSSCAVSWWPIFRKLGTCSTTDNLSPRTLLTKKLLWKCARNTPI